MLNNYRVQQLQRLDQYLFRQAMLIPFMASYS